MRYMIRSMYAHEFQIESFPVELPGKSDDKSHNMVCRIFAKLIQPYIITEQHFVQNYATLNPKTLNRKKYTKPTISTAGVRVHPCGRVQGSLPSATG